MNLDSNFDNEKKEILCFTLRFQKGLYFGWERSAKVWQCILKVVSDIQIKN